MAVAVVVVVVGVTNQEFLNTFLANVTYFSVPLIKLFRVFE